MSDETTDTAAVVTTLRCPPGCALADSPGEHLHGISVADIRADERRRVADLLDQQAETISAFAASPEAAVRMVALLLRMPFKEDA